MNKVFLVLISLISKLHSVGAIATPISEAQPVYNSTVLDLAVDASAVHLRVDYPGFGENNICGLKLTVSDFRYQTSNNLGHILTVTNEFARAQMALALPNSKTALIQLWGGYVAVVTISTTDGRTLREALKDLNLFEGDLLLTPKICATTQSP